MVPERRKNSLGFAEHLGLAGVAGGWGWGEVTSFPTLMSAPPGKSNRLLTSPGPKIELGVGVLSQARGSSPVPSKGPEGAEDPGRGSLHPLSDPWFQSIGIKKKKKKTCCGLGRSGWGLAVVTWPYMLSPQRQASPTRGGDLCHASHARGHHIRSWGLRTSPRVKNLGLSGPRSPGTGLKGRLGKLDLGSHTFLTIDTSGGLCGTSTTYDLDVGKKWDMLALYKRPE